MQLRLHRLALLRQAVEHEKLLTEHAHTESALVRDPLTGLGNRLRYDQIVAAIDAGLWSPPTSLLAIDVDNFKMINDTYSHTGGDRVLRAIGTILHAICRSQHDIAIRYAGDEFVVFLKAPLANALAVADRISSAVRTADISDVGRGARVSISTGVAALLPGMTGQELFRAADNNLYQAKRAGRDRVYAPSA